MRGVSERFEDKFSPEPNSGCWLWTARCNPNGYGYLKVPPGRVKQAHRISFELYRGPIPNGLSVLHKCDVRSCVNPDHLFLGTQKDNIQDMDKKGRGCRPVLAGERNPGAKLTFKMVNEIRALLSAGRRRHEIASYYGVSSGAISHIKCGRTWCQS